MWERNGKGKAVTILGHGPTRTQCPYDTEIWAVNNCYNFATRLDRLFIFDPVTTWEFDFKALHKVKQLVLSYPNPIFEKNSVVYPIRAILKHFNTNFFSNAICYMIALALYEGYEKIYFYGIDMMTRTTYVFEKGGVEYWMGIAHAMGVPIINTKESCTGKTVDGRMYGYFGPEFNNMTYHLEAVREQSLMLIQSFKDGASGVLTPDLLADPDGHNQAKLKKIFAGERGGIA